MVLDDALRLVYLTVLVSASGALSPGPLTVATIALGSRNGWRSGFQVAFGHTLVEVTYVTLLFYFFSYAKAALDGVIGDALTLMGSIIVLYFAVSTIREGFGYISGDSNGSNTKTPPNLRNPVLIGVLFTGLNVWFLLWWLSIGLELVSFSIKLGVFGLLLLLMSHLWLDYLWLILLAETGNRGSRIMGSRGHSLLMIALGLILMLFGLNMVLKRFTPYTILP
jgi:threonine/homoserine/homoserine lactone efflux protein